jgi:hypothetical protein
MPDARDEPSAGTGTPPDEAAPHSAQPTGQVPESQSSRAEVGGAASQSSMTLKERALAVPSQQVHLGALISMGALALGSIGPWATATVFGVTESAGGLHGGGWVTLVTSIVGFIALLDPQWASRAGWLYRHRFGTWRVLLWISIVVCILNFSSVEKSGLSGVVHPGWGLWLAFIASLFGIGAAYVLRVQARQSSVAGSVPG